jgi:hypothetical protein
VSHSTRYPSYLQVRFVKKDTVNGRVTRKLKWYGGVISGIANGGRRIRIKYDDGTAEIADFPDKDIIIDADSNGHHRVDAGAFIPPPPSDDSEEEERSEGLHDSPSPKKTKKQLMTEKIAEYSDGSESPHPEKKYRQRDDDSHDEDREQESKSKRGSVSVELSDVKGGEAKYNDSDSENEFQGSPDEKPPLKKQTPSSPKKAQSPQKSPKASKSASKIQEAVDSLPPPPLSTDAIKRNASSSSGSTCSDASFAGVDVADGKTKPSEGAGGEMEGDSLKKQGSLKEDDDVKMDEVTGDDDKEPPVKKHRPLSIRIAVPKRKRPEEEGSKPKGEASAPEEPNASEPSTKKSKHAQDDTEANRLSQKVAKEAEASAVEKEIDDADVSDGEIQENALGEAKAKEVRAVFFLHECLPFSQYPLRRLTHIVISHLVFVV